MLKKVASVSPKNRLCLEYTMSGMDVEFKSTPFTNSDGTRGVRIEVSDHQVARFKQVVWPEYKALQNIDMESSKSFRDTFEGIFKEHSLT